MKHELRDADRAGWAAVGAGSGLANAQEMRTFLPKSCTIATCAGRRWRRHVSSRATDTTHHHLLRAGSRGRGTRVGEGGAELTPAPPFGERQGGCTQRVRLGPRCKQRPQRLQSATQLRAGYEAEGTCVLPATARVGPSGAVLLAELPNSVPVA